MATSNAHFNENIRFHIDQLTISNTEILLKGWLFAELPIKRLFLSIGDADIELCSFGMESADVVAHFGPPAARSRFAERLIIDVDANSLGAIAILLEFISGKMRKVYLNSRKEKYLPAKFSNQLRLGIGITTFQRSKSLKNLLKKLFECTKTSFDLIVADDGSEDETIAMLHNARIPYLTGLNRGIAWNKNRALYYLNSTMRCDVIILLEDDSFPCVDAWEKDWIEAACNLGHVNLAGHWFKEKFISGLGLPKDPLLCFSSSGQCVAFSRKVIERVGYFDSRFGRYGFEHAEHSQRCIRIGYGGVYQPSSPNQYIYFLIGGGLTVGHLLETHGDMTDNALTYHALKDMEVHRWAWRGDLEMFSFLKEQDEAVLFENSAVDLGIINS